MDVLDTFPWFECCGAWLILAWYSLLQHRWEGEAQHSHLSPAHHSMWRAWPWHLTTSVPSAFMAGRGPEAWCHVSNNSATPASCGGLRQSPSAPPARGRWPSCTWIMALKSMSSEPSVESTDIFHQAGGASGQPATPRCHQLWGSCQGIQWAASIPMPGYPFYMYTQLSSGPCCPSCAGSWGRSLGLSIQRQSWWSTPSHPCCAPLSRKKICWASCCRSPSEAAQQYSHTNS